MSRNHLLDGNDRERRANAETCGGQSCREPTAVGEPFECIADASSVNGASPKTPYDLSDVQHRKRACEGVDNPSEPGETPTHKHNNLRSETIDEVALGGHQPGCKQSEKRERHLDRRQVPTEFLAHGNCEKCPAILEVGDHHHADDADYQLAPTGRFGSPLGRLIYRSHWDHSSRRQAKRVLDHTICGWPPLRKGALSSSQGESP